MHLSIVRQEIENCTDKCELSQVIDACKKRQLVLAKKAFDTLSKAAWDRVKKLPPGTPLYCCAQGVFMGGDWQRGDMGEVLTVQPRKKRLWLKRNGVHYWFEPCAVMRYNFQTEPPTDALPKQTRHLYEQLGKVFNK